MGVEIDKNAPRSVWYNILVEDTEDTFYKAIDSGCTVVQELMAVPDCGVSNAIFMEPFDIWMLHQINKEVSLEERRKIWEEEEAKKVVTDHIWSDYDADYYFTC